MEYLRFMAMYVPSIEGEKWRQGSFSQFGFINESSVWFTAWTLMTLRDAVYPEWEEQGLYIDPKLRADTAGFLLTIQRPNGSWAETSNVEDRNKFGHRLTNVSGTIRMLNLSVTAKVLVALHMNMDIDSRLVKSISGAIHRGRAWLEKYYRFIDDAFDMAIVTYALHLTNSAEQDAAFARLSQFKRMSENVSPDLERSIEVSSLQMNMEFITRIKISRR